ncbi:hypothetical protein [Granulosicoccus antarcticus]|uniref:hypothetical protein n=1 Tax=Granulosicoccus antarcticus TaxID=437505 RepID=UPI0012FE2B07|nr:hypothetical protein [Granulosicoccus antarcticus]
MNNRQHSTDLGRKSTITAYTNESNSEFIGCEYWKLTEGVHAWSGGDVACTFTDAEGPDASAEMIRFFSDTTSS